MPPAAWTASSAAKRSGGTCGGGHAGARNPGEALAIHTGLEVDQRHVAEVQRVGPARLRVIAREEQDLLDRRDGQRRGDEDQRRAAHLVRPATLLDAARPGNHHRTGALPQ